MLDREKYRLCYQLLGMDLAKSLEEISGEEPVYPKAVVHEGQIEIAEEGFKNGKTLQEIAEETGRSLSTIKRWKKKWIMARVK